MTRYRFGPFELELETGKLFRDGASLPLTRRKFDMLVVLLRNAGQVVTKEDLISQIWLDQAVDETNLTQQIYNLRRLLGEDSRQPEYIVTISGSGYRFNAPVQIVDEHGNPISPGLPGQISALPPFADSPTDSLAEQAREARSDSPAFSAIAPWSRFGRRLPRPSETSRLPLVLLGVALLGLGGLGVLILDRWSDREQSRENPPVRISTLASLPGIESYPAFSPDGKFVAFTSDGGEDRNEDLFVRQIGEGRVVRLTTHPATDHQVAWSPDGMQIAFLRAASPGEENRRYRLMTKPALGGTEREIARVWGGLDWSRDGEFLAVSDFEQNQPPTRIVLLSPEGNQRTVITPVDPSANFFDSFPRFSPDGTRLAFVRWVSDHSSDLFVVEIKTRRVQRLTSDQKRILSLQWTPDGEEILFVSNRQGRNQIWRIQATGGAPTQLTRVSDTVEHIALSRDGKLLTYSQQINDTVLEIHSLSSATRNKGLTQPLCTIDSSRTEFSPRFSPDGTQIVFTSAQTDFDEIWIANADCSGQQQITQFKEQGVGSPRWSPDGQSIVFDRRANQQADIFTIRLRTREIQQLTDHPSADIMPVWSPNGEWIYFTSERKGRRQIWKVSPKGGASLQVTLAPNSEGYEPMLSPDGQFLFYNLEGNLYRLSLDREGEPPVKMRINGYIGRQWTVQGDWLYYVASREDSRQVMARLNYRTQQREEICSIMRTFFKWEPGLSVSPDGSRVAFSFLHHRLGDLMMVEGWQ